MNQRQKEKYVGIGGALLVHLCLLLLLFLVGFTIPKPQEEGGVSVMLGEVPNAFGETSPELIEVDVLPEEIPSQPVEQPEQPLLTQEVEETVAIEKKQEEPIKQKTPEELEAERLAEEKRLAMLLVVVHRWVIRAPHRVKVCKEVKPAMPMPACRKEPVAMAHSTLMAVRLVPVACLVPFMMCKTKVV